MKIRILLPVALIWFAIGCAGFGQAKPGNQFLLQDNWAIQSSKEVKDRGDVVSQSTFQTKGWYPATVPSTVFGTLVKNKVIRDPYYGTNMDSVPGALVDRKRGIPDNSPFKSSWWYRTSFNLPADFQGKNTWLKFHSINYRANIWLNGHLMADTNAIEGAYRLYNLNITPYALAGKENCLAIEIFPPKGIDLTITWVDWNPTPPDRGMGIWYDVSVRSSGPVAIENPRIITDLDLPSTDHAKLSISAELTNTEKTTVTGVLKGIIDEIQVAQEVTLAPNETRIVSFLPDQFRQLNMANPKLWWPHTVGPQNLYTLHLSFELKGSVSDARDQRFGVREISSWMNNFDGKHTRVFQINGKNIVIRGGGYVQDMMLQPSDERVMTDIQYAKHMNLNALRMEGPRGSDFLFDYCDEQGIMLMIGWCCCSSFERWKDWTPHIADLAELSWKDQIVHMRNHPSIFDWLYGSDNYPPAEVEKRYIKVLNEQDGTRPYQSSATQDSSAIAGYTGLWMGPYPKVYSYFPPTYWYGKLEFNTEAGPTGEQIAPIESMRKMMPEKDLWPISNSWNIRLHKAFDPNARENFFSRYGEPKSVESYCMKSQTFQQEAVKAMFEAFASNKYRSSGIIYWMYNSAWPSLYWQLYDYYFVPNGAFYGARTACEPLHISYAYNDHAIRVVNSLYRGFKNLKATVKIYNFNMEEKFSRELKVDVDADESRKILDLENPKDLSDVYFLKLELFDDQGKLVSSNFYWLSKKGDEKADFTGLDKLPKVNLDMVVGSLVKEGSACKLSIELKNQGSSLAFGVNPKIIKGVSRELVAPVYWDDNYLALLPGEKRSLTVTFDSKDLAGEKPIIQVEGWNIVTIEKTIK